MIRLAYCRRCSKETIHDKWGCYLCHVNATIGVLRGLKGSDFKTEENQSGGA